ncbi:MAG: CHRD domain-containing protein [Pirellulales bacterium]
MVRELLVWRTLLVWASLATLCAHALAQEHHHHDPSDPSNPLACGVDAGETCFHGVIDDFHTVNSPHPDAMGEIHLALNAAHTQLRYWIKIDGLTLKPLATERTAPDDVIGVHLHLNVPDTVGPHVLNIFGLATYNMPAEEDADLVVDYSTRTLTGIYDDGDATIDPTTGQPYLPFYPLTSKPLSDWIDDLENGDLMVAVHTNASGFPKMAIHGHISQAVPEPATAWLLICVSVTLTTARRTRPVRRN